MKKSIKKITAVFVSVLIFMSSFSSLSFAGNVFTYKKGDVNEDGKLTSADARSALRFSVELDAYSKGHLIIGDMDGDGNFKAADARKILRLTVELDKNDYADVKVSIEQFSEYINKTQGSFTFTVYGWGHGVGLAQYGAIELTKAGYPFEDILSHYYTGTELKQLTNYPEKISYPMDYDEVSEKYIMEEVSVDELIARIVYKEIYGLADDGKYDYSGALKAQAVAVFTLLYYYDFNVKNPWNVGIASSKSYEELPEELRKCVSEVKGIFITEKGKDVPILSVYGASAAKLTASAEAVWEKHYPYLLPVESYCNPGESQVTYTAGELKKLINDYDSTIVLSEDPSTWLMIREHTSSIDEQRGYVVSIDVGNKRLHGNNDFVEGVLDGGLRSSCFTVTYTP